MTEGTVHSESSADVMANETPARFWKHEKLGYWIAFICLICIRMPEILLKGRFWAEEGSIFFMRAWYLPWHKVILAPYFGYLNLAANLAAVAAAHLVPLKIAPYVTSIFGLIVQSFPAILLLLSNRPFLQRRSVLIAALLIIATPPLSEEVWISSIGSQCHLNLCVGLILALETMKGSRAIFEYIILALAPLSGPGGAFLLPFFIARAIVEKSWERGKQAAVLGAATLLQLVFFFSFQARPLGIDYRFLIEVFYVRHILTPILGRFMAVPIAIDFRQLVSTGHPLLLPIISTIVVIAVFSIIYYFHKVKDSLWLLLSAVLLASLSYYGTLGDKVILIVPDTNERYSFAPQVMLSLSIVFFWATSTGISRMLARGLAIWLVVIGMHEYFSTAPFWSTGPSWHSQVRKWQADPNQILYLWPDAKQWHLQLDKNKIGDEKVLLLK